MRSENKAQISIFLNNLMAVTKILMCLFLIVILFTWFIQILELESYIPFYDNLHYFFNNLCYMVYTPTKEDDEAFDALMYIAIALVFSLLIFETITDILSDIIKLHEKNKEIALQEENEKINKEIQKNYKIHLKASVKFIALLKLDVVNPLNNTAAFKDEHLENEIKMQAQKTIKEVFSMISMSVKCQIKTSPEAITLIIDSPEQLNRILFFIQSVCQVEKFAKTGLEYKIAIGTYMADESPENAIMDAKKLLPKCSKNKILCYQIVSECLNLVQDNNFKAISYGDFTLSEATIYELVNKN